MRSPPLTTMSAQPSYRRRAGGKKASGKLDSSGRGRVREMELEDLENRAKGNEYLLEPEALNEKTLSPSRLHTTTGTGRYAPHLSASRSVQFTPSPVPTVSLSSSFPSNPYSTVSPPRMAPTSSGGHYTAPTSSGGHYNHVSSPSSAVPTSQRSAGTALGPVSSSHSNAGAVFGKPVKFGSWDRSRPTLEGAEVSSRQRLRYILATYKLCLSAHCKKKFKSKCLTLS